MEHVSVAVIRKEASVQLIVLVPTDCVATLLVFVFPKVIYRIPQRNVPLRVVVVKNASTELASIPVLINLWARAARAVLHANVKRA